MSRYPGTPSVVASALSVLSSVVSAASVVSSAASVVSAVSVDVSAVLPQPIMETVMAAASPSANAFLSFIIKYPPFL